MTAYSNGGPLILGDHVETFEQSFGHYLDASNPPEVIGVGNGMDALTLSLIALDLPAGSEVLVTASDGGFAAGAVRAAGHQPVVVDVEPNTHLVSEQTLGSG
ncbi:MAG: DegT/DnrJ/EryC1/StrS family aminotransferase [Marmoricola sp.]